MRRRDFLTQSSKSVLASALLPLEAVPVLAGQASRESRATRIPVARLAAELARQIPEWLRQANVPGLSIAVIQDARLAWRRAFGVRDASSNMQVDNDTLFEAASMSKPVFAYVVLKLCETGVMDLDTPADEVRLDSIPGRRSPTGPDDGPACAVSYRWFPELAVRKVSAGDSLHARQSVSLLRGGLQLSANRRHDAAGSALRALHAEPAVRAVRHDLQLLCLERRGWPPDGPAARSDRKTDRQQQVHGVVRRAVRVRGRASLHTIRLREVRRRRDRSEAGHCLSAETGQRQRDAPSPREARGAANTRRHGRSAGRCFTTCTETSFITEEHNAGFHCSAVASVAGRSGYVAMTNGENGSSVLTNLLTFDLTQRFLAG